MGPIRSRLTYANVMATIAVFIALGGGAYAALKLPTNSVGSRQLKSGAVTPSKVAKSTIKLFKGHKGDKGDKGDTGAQGLAGAGGVNGRDGAPGPSDIYAAGVADKALSTSQTTEIESLTVPAGSYLVGATLWFTELAAGGSEMDCQLMDDVGGSTRLNAGSTLVNDTITRATIPLAGAATFTAPTKITAQCTHVANAVNVSEARIWAISTGNLHATLPLPLD
jgi:hypothetical protein